MSRRRAKQRSKKGGGGPRKVALLIAVAIAIPVAVASALLLLSWSGGQSQPRAAVVDQLALMQPNPAFAQAATDMLEQAGYAVDYYPAEEVTVEFYRELPTRGYEMIILRTHSARLMDETDTLTEDVGIFTAEPYNQTRHLQELVERRLRPARIGYETEGLAYYFGVPPEFVESSMRGKFDHTMIIMMGCDGLLSDRLAEAFLQRGAGAFISWDGLVSAAHTDAATERLLRHLLIEGLPIPEAVAHTMAEVGPDPQYQSTLRAYP